MMQMTMQRTRKQRQTMLMQTKTRPALPRPNQKLRRKDSLQRAIESRRSSQIPASVPRQV